MMGSKPSPWDRLLARPVTARGTYTINTLAGVLSALVMVALQLITTRVLGAEAAGRVSVDTATVLLCFQIGQLYMRPVQATDLSYRFSYAEYLTLKTVTVGLMVTICFVYTILRGYAGERTLFCLAFCGYKAVESYSDCFWGMLHSKGRLDLAALGGALYHVSGILAFTLVLTLTRRLDAAALAMAFMGGANLLLYTWPLGRRLERPRLCDRWRRIGRLAMSLLPLFVAGYLLNVAITLPKYFLEASASETVQGHFAALYMTAQGVLLLGSFIYFPPLTTLARYHEQGDKGSFIRLLRRLGTVIVLVDAVLLAGGWLLGPELLGWLFRLDLTPYRLDLLLILLGGGCFALYTMIFYGLIAIQAQQGLALLTLVVLGAAAALNAILVPRLGIRGAAWGHLGTMALAALMIYFKLKLALCRSEGDVHGG